MIPASPADHDHQHLADLDAALDFVNTLEQCATRTHAEFGGAHEAVRTPLDALAWLLERRLLHADRVPRSDDWRALGRVRAVRAAFRELIDATVEERAPDGDAVDIVNELLGSRQLPALEPTATGVRLVHRHRAPPLDEALAGLAVPLVDRLGSADVGRVRVCANEHCRWAFYDDSRGGRRRWCDMTSCGNRAKAARHRARTKTDEAASPGEPARP